MTIYSDDPNNGERWVFLSGAGAEEIEPDIALSEAEHDFGEWYVSYALPRVLRIFNQGTDSLTVEDFAVDDDAFSLDWNGEVFKITPGGEYRMTVSFSPDEETEYAGELAITSDDPDEGELTVSLTGKGIARRRHFIY